MRRGEMRGLRLQPVYDDFNPQVEWVQEPLGYILRLYLPQVFRKEDLNIIYDQNGKITVRGRRLVDVNRFARFESSYNLPKDSNLEKIRGKLENNILSLTIPKIAISKPSEKKKEEPVMVEKPTMVAEERKGDEATAQKEKPTLAEEERKEHIDQKMKEEQIQKITTMEEKKEEPTLKEKPKIAISKTSEKKKEEPVVVEKPTMVAEERKGDEATAQKEKPTMAEEERKERIDQKMKEEPIQKITTMEEKKEELTLKEKPKIAISKTSEKKKEEPVVVEKPTMVAEERKGNEATAPKEKPTMAEEERKERIDQKMKEEPIQKITTMAEKKEEPTLKEKPKMVREERKEEKVPEDVKETAIVSKEKAMMAEEERKLDSAAVLKEMIEEARKIEMATGVRIKESAALKELLEKLQSMKEPNIADRKDEAVPNEVKKEEPTVKEKLKNLEEKNEAIQKEKLEGSDREKKKESTPTEETWEDAVKGESSYGHGTEVQEKQPNEKDSRKRRWRWYEEDKGWLDWLDGALEEVLQKIYRNKKCITLALVAFSTGYYISRKSRTRG